MAWTTAPFDPFATLGLDRDATHADIKARYRQLARRYHPNRNQTHNDGALAEYFDQIHQAWELLSTTDLRRRHVELLELYELHEAVHAAFADLVQANEQARSTTSTTRIGADGHESSDADEDDTDIPQVAGIKRRATFEQNRKSASHLSSVEEEEERSSDHAGSNGTKKRPRFSVGTNVEASGHDSGGNVDGDTAAMRRKQQEKLRKKELEAFHDYQDAMLDKFEAEEAAGMYRELYEQAKWRREYFERAPREATQRVKFARLVNKVATAFKSQRPPRRGETDPSNGIGQGFAVGGSEEPKQYLNLPSRTKSTHRRNWSNDLSGDQTSSDEDYSSDRGTSPSRSPRPSSPRPSLAHRRTDSGPSLLTSHLKPLPNAAHDPISPISGPVKVLIKEASSANETFFSSNGYSSITHELSRSPPPNHRHHGSSSGFTLASTTSVADAVGREDRRSRSPNAHHQSSQSRGNSPVRRTVTLETCQFRIKRIGRLQFRNIAMDHVHDLTTLEKQWMLGTERDADMDPDKLMARLESLDGNVAERYMVKPDIKAKFHFRLIYNHREVVKHQHQTFIALSYRRKLHVEKRHGHFTLPLEAEMFQAVWDERRSDTEGVWIDQICIDGDSDEEKTISMSAMDMVYRSARLVVVALDDILLESNEGAILSSHMGEFERMVQVPANKRFRRRQTPFLETHEDLGGVIRKMLRSSWFRRAWCRHEMRLAREHIFLIPCRSAQPNSGKSVIRMDGKCLTHLLGLATEIPMTASIEAVKPALYAFFRDRSRHSGHDYQVRSHHGNFTTVVAEVFAMEAGGDPRIAPEKREADARKDKISIILNTMECGLTLRPHMRDPRIALPAAECHYMLLILALAARDPGALSSVGRPLLQLPDAPAQTHVASTWLFEPTNVDSGLNNYRTLDRLPSTSNISTSADNGHHYIQLDLKFVGSGKVMHASDDPDTLAQARAVLDFCETHGLGRNRKRYLLKEKEASDLFGPMEQIYTETLACVLACGPDFLRSVAHRYGVSRYKQDLPAAVELLIALKSTSGRWPSHAWNESAAAFLIDLVNFLLIRGMPQRQIVSPEPWRPIWVDRAAGEGGKVLTFVPDGVIHACVPAALLDPDYIHLARLWVLEPRRRTGRTSSGMGEGIRGGWFRSGEWTLRGKSVLFSDDEAIEQLCEETSLVKERQKVFGRPPVE